MTVEYRSCTASFGHQMSIKMSLMGNKPQHCKHWCRYWQELSGKSPQQRSGSKGTGTFGHFDTWHFQFDRS